MITIIVSIIVFIIATVLGFRFGSEYFTKDK
jgi:hypothetical protein